MRTRIWLFIFMIAGGGLAFFAGDLAAGYVAIGIFMIMFMLHAIEVKLNRLLDDRRIHVSDWEIAKD